MHCEYCKHLLQEMFKSEDVLIRISIIGPNKFDEELRKSFLLRQLWDSFKLRAGNFYPLISALPTF